jgi:hypothetical protein
MLFIQYPEPAFRIKKEEGRELLFDRLRKKWVVLTPEEWVRQNFIRYLTETLAYPLSLIAVEKEFRLGELKKRFDILVYNNQHEPWMMVECKAMDIELNESVLQQLLRYHISLPVEYLVITNGKHCYGFRKSNGQLLEIEVLPPVVK